MKVFAIALQDITPQLARRSGFVGVVDLLKVAKHGPGRRVFVVEFTYVPPSKRGGSAAYTPPNGRHHGCG